MKTVKILSLKIYLVFLILGTLLLSCSKDFMDKQPLASVTSTAFWQNESDAMRGLTSVYDVKSFASGWSQWDFFQNYGIIMIDLAAGWGDEKDKTPSNFINNLTADFPYTKELWVTGYQKIARCNVFLENIGTCKMDTAKKAEFIAEVRTIRAFTYFNLALYFNKVPLATKVLTVAEANSISQTPQEDVISFCETELNEVYADLPVLRPASQLGRITRGAALAILGRVQMQEEKWGPAANTYKLIIDSEAYIIDPRFKELFWEEGDGSQEIIWSTQFVKNIMPTALQLPLRLMMQGGYHQYSVYNNFVEKFLCTDGKTTDQSAVYDPLNPYANRDPRLGYSVCIPDVTVLNGTLYKAYPYSTALDALNLYTWTGYTPRKYLDENYYPQDPNNYGGNQTLIRYPEVLLSYLECMIESGGTINQSLLDNTINLIRSRAAVLMPPVTETDPGLLRTIVRNERGFELAFEGLHYYDLLRWGTLAQEANGKFAGMHLTSEPDTFTLYPVDDKRLL